MVSGFLEGGDDFFTNFDERTGKTDVQPRGPRPKCSRTLTS
jgi:hypothetical protein